MGYESRVYIVEEWKTKGKMGRGEVIAVLDLYKMGWDTYNGKTFRELFNQKRTCDFYDINSDKFVKSDGYGAEIKKADPSELIAWLVEFSKHDDYWRARMILAVLKQLEDAKQEYSVYHYGH